MTRNLLRTMAALAAALVALALAPGVRAGGWSLVVLDSASASVVGGALQAGAPFEVGFTVLQHGVRPIDGLTPRIALTPDSGGAPASFTATAEGPPGHYVATITLPAAGVWRWQIDAFGPPSVLAPLSVAPAPAPAAPEPPPALAGLLVAAAAGGALGLGLLALRRRRPVPVSQ